MADRRFGNTSTFIPAINVGGIRPSGLVDVFKQDMPNLPGAACKGVVTSPDDDLFFPEQVKGGRRRAKQGKEMCMGCPVRQECLDWALEWDRTHPNFDDKLEGIWGGLNMAERKRLLKETNAA